MRKVVLLFFLSFYVLPSFAVADYEGEAELRRMYGWYKKDSSKFGYLSDLKDLASECCTIATLAPGSIDAAWPILLGLSETKSRRQTYLHIDPTPPPKRFKECAKTFAKSANIALRFLSNSDDLPEVDMLFIDDLSSFESLASILEKLSARTRRFLAIRQTVYFSTHESVSLCKGLEKDPFLPKENRWLVIYEFLSKHPEWALYKHYYNSNGFVILKRTDLIKEETTPQDKEVEDAISRRIILCTGPSFNRKLNLQLITENDLKFIPFKKIFLTTNDPNNIDIKFNEQSPILDLIENQGHQLDCTNCALRSLWHAANDPDSTDEDIILFKHESVFINDMHLVKKAIRKLLDGYEAVTRFTPYLGDGLYMSDNFFIKVDAVKRAIPNLQWITSCPLGTERHLSHMIFGLLSKVYRVPVSASRKDEQWAHWEDNELGFFHIWPHKTRYSLKWNKSNYKNLYN